MAYKESGRLPDGSSTGPVPFGMKGTLLEGALRHGRRAGPSAAGGSGCRRKIVPADLLRVSAVVWAGDDEHRSLCHPGNGDLRGGGVAESGEKLQSTHAYSTIDEPVKKIATSIKTSDELLSDAPAVQQLVNNDLARFVNIEAERQLLRGTAGGNEVQGLLTSRNVPIYTTGTAVGNIAEQMFKAMNRMRGSAFLEPDWVVMSPSDYEKLRLLKDAAGQHFGGGRLSALTVSARPPRRRPRSPGCPMWCGASRATSRRSSVPVPLWWHPAGRQGLVEGAGCPSRVRTAMTRTLCSTGLPHVLSVGSR
jgi:hypothetical protein